MNDVKALDTCFVLWLFSEEQEHQLLDHSYVLTSFNYEELMHVSHRHSMHHNMKQRIRHFFKAHPPHIAYVNVHPGNHEGEVRYVSETFPEALQVIPDTSDAVLVAYCLKTKTPLVTRDKHDIFHHQTLFNKYNIPIHTTLKD